MKADPAYRTELAEALRTKSTRDMNQVILVSSAIPEHRPYCAKSLIEIGRMMGGVSPEEAAVRLLASGSSPQAAFGSMSEDNMNRILADPYVVCCSDSTIRAKDKAGGHPRGFGIPPCFSSTAARPPPLSSIGSPQNLRRE